MDNRSPWASEESRRQDPLRGPNPPQPPYQQPQPDQQASPLAPVLRADQYDFRQVTILDDSIRVATTNQILYDISRPPKLSLSLSEKPAIVIGRSDMQSPLGSVRTHSLSNSVDLTFHGQATSIKLDPLTYKRWDYKSITSPGAVFAWFKRESDSQDTDKTLSFHDAVNLGKAMGSDDGLGVGDVLGLAGGKRKGVSMTLRDATKHGRVIAELGNNVLTFQMSGLTRAMMDEVMVAAVGISEGVKRKQKQDQLVLKAVIKPMLGTS